MMVSLLTGENSSLNIGGCSSFELLVMLKKGENSWRLAFYLDLIVEYYSFFLLLISMKFI